jgi:hypothetical protein
VLRCRIRILSGSSGPLLAAGLALAGGAAPAQAPQQSVYDPFAPYLQTDPRSPSRFLQQAQASSGLSASQLMPPVGFMPLTSGAGSSGFDATNSRKTKKAKGKATASAQATAPGLAAAPQPYHTPPPELPPPNLPSRPGASGNGAYAQMPGAPPVELGPIREPKKRKAHTEPDAPYSPLGVEAGAFTLFPAIELIGGYNTNPGATQGGNGAWLYTVFPELLARSNWSRHEFKADLRGSYTGYNPDQSPTLSRPFFDGKVDGRIDATHDTRIDLGVRDLVTTDNPGSPNLSAGLARLPVFNTFGASAGLGQRFNRFVLEPKFDYERTTYQKSELVNGTTASNDDRNYDQYRGILRGSYELAPGVTPFVEVAADTRKHDLQTDYSGYQRNSNGIAGLVGSSFELPGFLTGEFGIGYARRVYEDPRLQDLSGLIGNASLIWTATALTKVNLSAASSIGESTVPGVSGVFYRDVGLQVDHAFRRWLIGTVKVRYENDKYVGMVRDDNIFSIGGGLTYKVTRMVQIKGELRQDWLRSNVTGADYNATIVLVGVRLQR